MRRAPRSVFVATVAVLFSFPVGAGVRDALEDGRFLLDLRYRFENVDDASKQRDANASTIRLRAGYKTGSYHGFFALGEFEAVEALGSEQYNSSANGKTEYAVVLDPEDTEVNRLFLGYTGFDETTIKFGRQRVILDNHRFFGTVGFRQNEQTFDALSVKTAAIPQVTLFVARINNANRIHGEHHTNLDAPDLDLTADLLHVSRQFSVGTLAAYLHLIENEDTLTNRPPGARFPSHSNLGFRFQGSHEFSDDLELLYAAEYADQSNYKGGATNIGVDKIDVDYQLAELGVRVSVFTAKLGYEVLGGDGRYGFQTPLATLHAFNGWTDQFTTTPPTGLDDRYFSVGVKVAGIQLTAVYHEFEADKGGVDFGTESGVRLLKKFGKGCAVDFKYARFEADSASPGRTDIEKLWLALQFKL